MRFRQGREKRLNINIVQSDVHEFIIKWMHSIEVSILSTPATSAAASMSYVLTSTNRNDLSHYLDVSHRSLVLSIPWNDFADYSDLAKILGNESMAVDILANMVVKMKFISTKSDTPVELIAICTPLYIYIYNQHLPLIQVLIVKDIPITICPSNKLIDLSFINGSGSSNRLTYSWMDVKFNVTKEGLDTIGMSIMLLIYALLLTVLYF